MKKKIRFIIFKEGKRWNVKILFKIILNLGNVEVS